MTDQLESDNKIENTEAKEYREESQRPTEKCYSKSCKSEHREIKFNRWIKQPII